MDERWRFLTTPRRDWPLRPVPDRVDDWRDVHVPDTEVPGGLLPLISAQAARCMDCGIPFCHHACPLGNLIPDWNALTSRDDWDAAVDRLHATNNFPEFTGSLCPAPCESACVLAIGGGDAVAIKAIEAAVADHAWEHGLARPVRPESHTGARVAVIGSGPAGLAAAQQLTRAGHEVVVYERDDRIGGLLRYGIPAFKMDKRNLERRIAQLEAEGTVFRPGVAVGTGLDAGTLLERHGAVVVASGATRPRELTVPGRELAGVHQAMEYLVQANRVQEGDYPRPPISAEGRRVVIVGGGDTGADCLGTALRQHAASVVQLDIKPQPEEERPDDQPWPTYPRIHRLTPAHEEGRDLVRLRVVAPGDPGDQHLAGEHGDVRVFAATTVRLDGDERGRVRALHLSDAEPGTRRPVPGTERVIPAELVLLALGFSGPEDAGLVDQLGLRLGPTGAFVRDEEFAGGHPGVFVAGDAGRGQSLVVWAIAEGRAAAAAADRYLRGRPTELPTPIAASDRPLAL